MSGLYPLSRMQQFDRNGRLLDGARLFLYDGGTSTPRVGYADGALSTPLPWPVLADASGRLPLIYLDDGFYRQRLTTSHGDPVFDDDGIPVLSSGGGGSGTTVDPNALYRTRDIKFRFDNAPINGYVRLNGLSIGSSSSGATERANADTQSLFEELWPFAKVVVTGGKGASGAADFAANKKLILPNASGRSLFGLDNMGGGPANLLTSATVGDPNAPGAFGGSERVTLSKSVMPNYELWGPSLNVTAAGTTDFMDRASTHNHNGTTGGMNRNNPHRHYWQGSWPATIVGSGQPGGESETLARSGNSPDISYEDINHEHSVTVNTVDLNHKHNVNVAGSTNDVKAFLGGDGNPLLLLSPALLVTIYLRL